MTRNFSQNLFYPFTQKKHAYILEQMEIRVNKERGQSRGDHVIGIEKGTDTK